MELFGQNYLGSRLSGMGNVTFQAIDPASNLALKPEFLEATEDEIDEAVQLAANAFKTYRKKGPEQRALLLDTIAMEIESMGSILVERCCTETGLPEARITGERARTTGQLRLFANLLREGSWVNARIDTGDPDRKPLPKPDVRSMQMSLGPVGIFGASNFPLAFSVAGGDTASALAAGCTVVIKAHPAHPGTSELVARAILKAVQECDMPDGIFSLVHGASNAVGLSLVQHPLIKAIGFTGSYRGGKALFDVAASREEPIPVYAEMGSVNPVFILPGAMQKRSKEIANGLSASITLGVGQFCTNPGLVVTQKSEAEDSFYRDLSESISVTEAGTMLTPTIHQAFERGKQLLNNQSGVLQMAKGKEGKKDLDGTAAVFRVSGNEFMKNDALEEEIFGPSSLVISCDESEQLLSIASKMKGHLTASVFGTEEELEERRDLIEILEQKVGRLIFNGFPTGVEVCHAMIHGGPFPATTDVRNTSVGTAAIYRFTRPVCFQNFPEHLLPDELRDSNPKKIFRLYDAQWGH